MICRPPSRNRRAGLTLIEVLLATAIFLLSLVAIGQLLNMSSDQAIDVQARSRATRLAQSKLAEYTAGVRSLDGGGTSGDFEEEYEPDWNYEVSVEADNTAVGLYKVTVTVTWTKGDLKTSLSQYVFDPKKRGVILATQQATTTATTTTTNQSSTGTTTNSGTTTNTNSSSSTTTNSGTTTGGRGQ